MVRVVVLTAIFLVVRAITSSFRRFSLGKPGGNRSDTTDGVSRT